MLKEVRTEIRSFHKFLQNWIAGNVPKSKSLFRSEIADHFEKSFEFVMPDGTHMRRREIVNVLKSSYGTDPTFQIKVKIRSVRPVGNGVFLALYEELQVEEGKKSRRLSLAVLGRQARSRKVTWHHCHESPLPSAREIGYF